MYKIKEHIVCHSEDPHDGKTEWWLDILLSEGLSLFYPECEGGLYQALKDKSVYTSWIWYSAFNGDGEWWTRSRDLAEEFIANHICKIDKADKQRFKLIKSMLCNPGDPDYEGKDTWFLMISLDQGMSLFYPRFCNDYFLMVKKTDKASDWTWHNATCVEPYSGFWMTENRNLAERFMADHLCELEVKS